MFPIFQLLDGEATKLRRDFRLIKFRSGFGYGHIRLTQGLRVDHQQSVLSPHPESVRTPVSCPVLVHLHTACNGERDAGYVIGAGEIEHSIRHILRGLGNPHWNQLLGLRFKINGC